MTKKFKEAPEEKTTTFYNMGGWTQSERKTEFVNRGKEIAEKRGIPMYNPDIGTPLGQRALMSYQLSGTDTFVEGDDLHFINNTAIQQAWDDIRKTVIVGLNTAHNVLEKRLGYQLLRSCKPRYAWCSCSTRTHGRNQPIISRRFLCKNLYW